MSKTIHAPFLLVLIAVSIFSVVPAFAQTTYDNEKKEFDVYVEKTLAHFHAAEINLDQGNDNLAAMHATHPISELYDLMKPELDEYNSTLSTEVKQILSDLGNKVGQGSNKQDAMVALDNANQVLDKTRDIVVGDVLYDNIPFKIDVINELLESSISEYEEGVSDGKVVAQVKFQDASAFVWQSQQLYESIKSQIPENNVKEIDELYGDLFSNYDKKAPVSEIDTMTDNLKSKFNVAGGSESKTVQLSDYLANVKNLLNQAKGEYSEGNKDEALSLVTKAYLNNFEYLEPTIANNNLQLKQDLEKMIREDLRDMIKNGASVSDVSAKIDSIQSKLDQIAAIVPEFGTIIGSVFMLAIALIIVISMKSNRFTPRI